MPAPLLRRLLMLTVLAVLFVFLADLLTGAPVRARGWAGAPSAALRSLPDGLLPVLAVVAGIAAATLAGGPQAKRQAASIVVVVTAMMLLALGASSTVAPMPRRELPHSLQVMQPDTSARATYAAADRQRLNALQRTERLGLLLLPTVLVGIMLGLRAWIDANVIFRTARGDATVMRAIGWLVSPAVVAALLSWSNGYGYDVLFRGRTHLVLLIPYVPALTLAFLGWRAELSPSPMTHAVTLNQDA